MVREDTRYRCSALCLLHKSRKSGFAVFRITVRPWWYLYVVCACTLTCYGMDPWLLGIAERVIANQRSTPWHNFSR